MPTTVAASIPASPLGLSEGPLEIRAALPEDRAEAFALQRAAFSLPDGDPPSHPGNREELRVAVRDGRVVSCLTLIHAALCMRGVHLPMGGIRHVATHPDEQNRGYASALLRDTLRELRRDGVSTSVLFPFSFRYYRKFGYELGGNHCHFWCRPNCIPVFAERWSCREAAPTDVPALARFYAERGAQSVCSMVRDERRWERLCADPDMTVLIHGGPQIDGYAVITETRDSYGGRVLRVLDLAASTPAGWRALLGHLSQSPVESVEWLASEGGLAESGLMRSPAPLREGFKPRGIVTIRPMFQFRVVDLAKALRSRLPLLPRGDYQLALRVRDDLLPENAAALTVVGAGEQVTLRAARPDDPCLEMDVRVFSQLFCGYMGAAEAVSQELGRCSSDGALETADQLFPAGEPFISELDRF